MDTGVMATQTINIHQKKPPGKSQKTLALTENPSTCQRRYFQRPKKCFSEVCQVQQRANDLDENTKFQYVLTTLFHV